MTEFVSWSCDGCGASLPQDEAKKAGWGKLSFSGLPGLTMVIWSHACPGCARAVAEKLKELRASRLQPIDSSE